MSEQNYDDKAETFDISVIQYCLLQTGLKTPAALFFADNVNFLGENTNTIKHKTLLDSSTKIGNKLKKVGKSK
jgi:hypothetical protein